MTTDGILEAADSLTEEILPVIALAQDDYLSMHGTYFRAIMTHSEIPVDGNETEPDQASDSPGAQCLSWDELEVLPETMGAALRIDQYQTPEQECGYVVLTFVGSGGSTWIRQRNFGPNAAFEKEWTEQIPPE